MFCLLGSPGCLAGSVKLIFKRGCRNGGRVYSVLEAYHRFNNIGRKESSMQRIGPNKGPQWWADNTPTFTLSYKADQGIVGYHQIEAVLYSGPKVTFTVLTETEKSIRVTSEHPFRVPDDTPDADSDGFKKLSALRVGDLVLCRRKDLKPPVQGLPEDEAERAIIVGILYHPFAWRQVVGGFNYKRIHYSRLVVEAEMNRMRVCDFIDILKHDERKAANLKYLPPEIEVHHKDKSRWNDLRGNLELLTKTEHARLHGKESQKHFGNVHIEPEVITKIEEFGVEDTFDLIMQAPYRNYVANDFVVHNTGKTTLIRALVKANEHSHIAVCAPTGKAAKRAEQATGHQATTIHRLLKVDPYGDKDNGSHSLNFAFQFNAKHKLPQDLVIVDECFLEGTLVDTPTGSRPIGSLAIGDSVLNAEGVGKVRGIKTRVLDHCVRILLSDGRQMVCSENHPFFTLRGLTPASEIEEGDVLYDRNTALRVVREGPRSRQEAFLWELLRVEMENGRPGETQAQRRRTEALANVGTPGSAEANRSYPQAQPHVGPCGASQDFDNLAGDGPQAADSGRKWPGPDIAAINALAAFRNRVVHGIFGFSWEDSELSNLLQAGYRESVYPAWDRSRWLQPQRTSATSDRPKERSEIGSTWVESIEIYESGSAKFRTISGGRDTAVFFDLDISGHPSFSVGGILVHNCSMVDIRLFADLLEALRPDARLVLIGDTHQLPSVGPGRVLSDLVASGEVPYTELTQLKRQDPTLQIARNCARLKAGEVPAIDNANFVDFFFIPVKEATDIANEIVSLQTERLPKKYGIDGQRDIVTLTALREGRGKDAPDPVLSAAGLNARLRKVFNPSAPADKKDFAQGDRVIQLTNNYQLDVYNGDCGTVMLVENKSIAIDWDTPRRSTMTSVKELNLAHAWALTVHKFQGSEIPWAIIPIHKSNGSMVATRQHLYTALSRGKQGVVVVGDYAEMEAVVARVREQRRYTRLAVLLQE